MRRNKDFHGETVKIKFQVRWINSEEVMRDIHDRFIDDCKFNR